MAAASSPSAPRGTPRMTVQPDATRTARPDKTRTALPRGCVRRTCTLDHEEQACLFLARCCFNYYTAPSEMLWKRAMRAAQAEFGRDHGLDVFHALTVVLARLRESRAGTFLYNKPDCPSCSAWLTTHEASLVRAISATRRDDPCTALMMGQMLCDRTAPERLLHGLTGLAVALRQGGRA